MKLKLTQIAAIILSLISLNLTAQNKNSGLKKAPIKPNNSGVVKQKIEVRGNNGNVNKGEGNIGIKTNIDSLSYAVGMNIGQLIKQQGLDNIDLNLLKAAMNDVMKGSATLITQEQVMPVIMANMKKISEQKYAGVKLEGINYCKENAKKEGVTVMPSGLQYSILKKGEGEIPKATDKVNVHYHGTLMNGKVFDSSVDRGAPASFGVTQVIAGWVEALQLMPVGSKWKLVIPSDLAYGERGAGENIPPYSTLIFEVELLSIDKAVEPAK